MENGPEPTPHGPIWPNKARKRILTPIRIHPIGSQPLAAPERNTYHTIHKSLGKLSRQIQPNDGSAVSRHGLFYANSVRRISQIYTN